LLAFGEKRGDLAARNDPSMRARQQKKTGLKKAGLKRHFSRALRELRLQRGWTQGDLAKYLGVTTGAVGNWETEANGVTVRRLKILSDKVGLPVEYFRGGTAGSGAAGTKAAPFVVLERGRRAPVITWERALEARDQAELSRPAEEQTETDCKDPNCFAVVVEGDSMEPEVLAGDIVVFAPNSEPRNGDLVICRLKEGRGLLLRRFHRSGAEGRTIRLESMNPNYQPVEIQAREMGFAYPAVQINRKLRR
jgi:SOS-response transcriptional repressor LexA